MKRRLSGNKIETISFWGYKVSTIRNLYITSAITRNRNPLSIMNIFYVGVSCSLHKLILITA